MSLEAQKKAAAEKAVRAVKSGMVLGLGTGSSARYATMKIGELYQAGQLTNIIGIATSESTVKLAQSYGIRIGNFVDYPHIDVTIDGADEIDPQFQAIKGLGGALLREKMVERATKHFIAVVDSTKQVDYLGQKRPLPVEIVQFGWQVQARWLQETFGCEPTLRGGEESPFVTDNYNFILDCHFPDGIKAPSEVGAIIHARTGIVEHGLFLNMVNEVIIGHEDGTARSYTVNR